ncbi:putative amidoligase domain-containing protein [Chengkuizengella sediminis]|uniref:putative amidoligase domain-containing protein n=1 Tax=Chengkuizengella sediminis TaxID=1885917 RepID=UPI001389D6E9|nr:hypothetical protein [Chengkuizengella sediminis]NDI34506.1 hypothetical protein [Chengkuizengella sediminis]
MNQLFLLHGNDPAFKGLWNNSLFRHGTQLPDSLSKDTVIIQWGNETQVSDEYKVLNPAHFTEKAKDKELIIKILNRQGIHVQTPFSQNVYLQVFLVPVFHLKVLTLYRCSLHTENVLYPQSEVSFDLRNRQHRLISRYAIRAIYALGLDYGVVKVGLISARKCTILDMDPTPKLDRNVGELFSKAIRSYHGELIEERRRTKKALLGLDVEFLLRNDKGKITFASNFLKRRGKVGCDSVVNGNKWIFPIAELRPSPSKIPKQLTNNIIELMHIAQRQINDPSIEWLAGGMPVKGLPLGGHIHMSQIWLNSFLLRVLDNYLTLPIMMLEDRTSLLRRPKYGFLGDFRTQIHGGFEYRSLPSWIVTPSITKGVLTLTRLITDHYWNLKSRPLNDETVQTHFYNGNKEPLYPYVKEIWSELEGLDSYATYSKDLQAFKKQLFEKRSWNEQLDIRTSWRIPPFDTLPKK